MVFVTASTLFLAAGTTKMVQASRFVPESHIFNPNSRIEGLVSLNSPVNYVAQRPVIKIGSAKKPVSKKVNAVNLDGKLLVIKGFTAEGVVNPETEVSIDELNALSQINETSVVDSSANTQVGDILATEIIVDIPPLTDEPVALEDDGEIEEYEVQNGDTLASISQKFNISVDTIVWANDLKKNDVIKVGRKLAILPISGVAYTIKSGDTVSGIADKFDVSQRELVEFNDLEDGRLIVGQRIIIPGGTLKNNDSKPAVKNTPKSSTNNTAAGYFSRPLVGGVKSQGIHGHNGIDIAGPIGLPVLAARDGVVTLVRGGSSWNGGYGNYVVITHDNGIKTLYAHMNSISVTQGQKVARGKQVGTLGNTGRSTGPHLHFEVRGAKNPF